MDSGKELRRLKGQKVFGKLSFSPDGRFLLAGNMETADTDRTARMWDVTTGKEVWRLDTRPWLELALAFAPDGRTVAGWGQRYTGRGAHEPAVFLSDAATGKELRRWKGHEDWVYALAFAPDGRMLVTGSRDRTIRFWELATGQERRPPLTAPAGVIQLAFSPDGRRLASVEQSFTALIWDLGLSPDGGPRVRHLPPAELAGCWDDLAAGDAARAYRTVLRLAAAPDQAVALLRERLRPIAAADPRRVADLVAGLNGDAFAEREKAEQDLLRLGFAAEPALRQALTKDMAPEARRRVGNVLERLQGAEAIRATRALEALEQAGTPEARQLLKALAAGAAEARLTQEAKASLERLARRPPAAR
ncbi:MAG TPA: hypothetical protein VJ739_00180 [Gemmataceae bacterium]|nr:hypothetical protein [Gemmataceae bacterium]